MLIPYSGIKGPINNISILLKQELLNRDSIVSTECWGKRNEKENIIIKILNSLLDIYRIRKKIKTENFDLLLIHTAHDWSALLRVLPLLVLVHRKVHQIILQFHGSKADLLVNPGNLGFKIITYIVIRLSDAVLVLSSAEQRKFYSFYPQGRIYQVINPFVPIGNTSVFVDNVPLEVHKSFQTILFVGRLIEEKGIFDLIRAMPTILTENTCRLMVVGEGPQEERMRALAMDLGITDHVTFRGYLIGNELLHAYQNADIFVFPTWHEGFPSVIAEAMDIGLSIVTTQTGGIADYLIEGINALFVPPRDPFTLAKAVIRLLNDHELMARMGRANKIKLKEFSPEKSGKIYFDVLVDITKHIARN